MSTHEARVVIDTYDVGVEFRCTADDDAVCRQACAEGCEQWPEPRRRHGRWYHDVLDEAGYIVGVHEMRRLDYCGVVEWLANSDYTYRGPTVEVRSGWSPIDVEWDDGYVWRYPEGDG